jgi:antirestriction protein ArdC
MKSSPASFPSIAPTAGRFSLPYDASIIAGRRAASTARPLPDSVLAVSPSGDTPLAASGPVAPERLAKTGNQKEQRTMDQNNQRQDVYSRITAQIIASLEKGVRPWVRPWNAQHAAGRITRPLRHNGQPYTGINVLSLWTSALAQNFTAPIWMTFRQALELKAHVRKAEKGSLVVYANSITRTETDGKTGDETEREIHFLKGYTVFNVEQIEGLPAHYYAVAEPQLDPLARIEHAEKFFAATGVTINHGGNRAFYSHGNDAIQLPPFESFRDADSYYGTLAHETVHSSAHKKRLDRDFGGHRFGSEAYAIEELVAELGAAFICADLEIALEAREDHAAYIASWLKVLSQDTRAVFTAASHAQRAADFIHAAAAAQS